MKTLQWTIIISMVIGIIVYSFYSFQVDGEQVQSDDEQEGLEDQVVIKFSHVVAENTPKGLAAQRFASLVQQKTDNRVKVEVYPNGSLYRDEAELEALQQGSIQMIAPASTKLSEQFPPLALLDLPFAFSSHEHVQEALEGSIGEELKQRAQNDQMLSLSIWNNGFKQMTSNQGPLIEPEDFKGERFRVMPGDVIKSQFQALGAQPETASFNVTYQKLASGELTGQENTLSNIYSKRFYEVQSHLTLSNHGLLSYVVLMNKDFWEELSSEIQQVIQEAMDEATQWNYDNAITLNEKAKEHIQDQSDIEVHRLTEEERELWESEVEVVYEQFRSEIGGELIEMLAGLREEN
ncbi:DctP family TRAP transporter solute-binding subunit [Pontibacillus sp. ALD_SL1]|uniref:DctP family TRAP transporter solute-binding subunit n=1 Tax=Pontibacillus sp. ALD_SL1 TaxID=2777185 RepID=UPI001A959CC1|nr:DctP family TRAP transporter solute-binding subunit [Pontibacillus sp. ALD_SL1]QST00997.1 DctP family TRAP transporter solute-binding subunit [Pontibacillus sp. ALD_SL1]